MVSAPDFSVALRGRGNERANKVRLENTGPAQVAPGSPRVILDHQHTPRIHRRNVFSASFLMSIFRFGAGGTIDMQDAGLRPSCVASRRALVSGFQIPVHGNTYEARIPTYSFFFFYFFPDC